MRKILFLAVAAMMLVVSAPAASAQDHDHGEEPSCHGEGDDFHCHGLPEGATCELGEGGEITCEGLPEGADCHGTVEDFHCHGLEGDHDHGDEAGHSHEDEGHSHDHGDEAGHSHDHETDYVAASDLPTTGGPVLLPLIGAAMLLAGASFGLGGAALLRKR